MQPIGNILHQLLKPINMEKDAKYRWITKNNSIEYGKWNGDSDNIPLEIVCSKINDILKKYQSQESFKQEDRTNLQQLGNLITEKTDKYINSHKGFFGSIWLFFRGLGNGGHIEKVRKKVLKNINSLSRKPLTPDISDINTFLNLISPVFQDLNISLIELKPKRWVYDANTNLILDVEYKEGDPLEDGWTIDPTIILKKLNEQLGQFSNLQETSILQKEQIKQLKSLIVPRIGQPGVNGNLVYHGLILQTLDNLLKLKDSAPPTEEAIAKMEQQAKSIVQELQDTEKNFSANIGRSIIHLQNLQKLSTDTKIKYDQKFSAFFKNTKQPDAGDHKAYLEDCQVAFNNLMQLSEFLVGELKDAIAIEDLDDRNEALFNIYNGALFQNYSKAASVCARYYAVLSAFHLDLNKKNDISKINSLKLYFKDDPTLDFITPIQRLPRHHLLTHVLLKNTSTTARSYRQVLGCYQKAYTYSVDLDRRVGVPFTV